MLFGLKNAGATYQRAMTALFHDMIHKEMEVYVDDMIAKSWAEEELQPKGIWRKCLTDCGNTVFVFIRKSI